MGLGRPQALATVALAGVLACDAQADRGYLGEPLATLRGHVGSAGSLPPLEAAMLWQRGPPPSVDDVELATRAPVESGFPARFTLRLYQPPPAAALRTLAGGEVVWARANAAAVPYGIAGDALGNLPAAANPGYGVDGEHWVVWLSADAPASSLTAWWLGAALLKGFHLMQAITVDPSCLAGATLEACVTELVLRGVADDGTGAAGTARYFCGQPYRLAPAPPDEEIVLELGDLGGGPRGAACP